MSTWKRFWFAVLLWSAALCVLLGAYSLLAHFTSDDYRGPGAILLALHSLGSMLGLLFPLVVFFAALGTPQRPGASGRPLAFPALIAAPVVAGALEYVWLALVEPWSKVWIFRWSIAHAGANFDPMPVASTQAWVAAQIANPAVGPADALYFTWLFHLPNSTGLLTALLALAGFLVGRRAVTSSQRWTMATLVTAIVAPMLLASLRLTTRYEVPAAVTTYGILLLPLFLLAVLGWIDWTDRERAPRVATS